MNGRLAGTVWSRQDEAGSHVCREAWLQLPAERGALPTPQSATGSQLGGDIHWPAALAALLPCYGFSGPEAFFLPALGDIENFRILKHWVTGPGTAWHPTETWSKHVHCT